MVECAGHPSQLRVKNSQPSSLVCDATPRLDKPSISYLHHRAQKHITFGRLRDYPEILHKWSSSRPPRPVMGASIVRYFPADSSWDSNPSGLKCILGMRPCAPRITVLGQPSLFPATHFLPIKPVHDARIITAVEQSSTTTKAIIIPAGAKEYLTLRILFFFRNPYSLSSPTTNIIISVPQWPDHFQFDSNSHSDTDIHT
jgi:hypothetical protein